MAGSPLVPAECRTTVQRTRVAVVGAGFAGLLAARTLARSGMRVSVFEARNQVGGRVRSDVNFGNGRITEMGAELVGSIHTRWCALATEYGISLISRMNDDLYAGQQLGVPLVLDKPLNRSEIAAMETAKRAVQLRLARAAAHIVDPAQPWKQPRLRPFDGLSVAQALVALGVTPGSRLWLGLRHLLENNNVAPLEELNLLGLLCLIRGGQTGTIATDRVGRLMGYWDELEIYRCGDGCQTLARKVSAEVSRRPHCGVVTSRAVTAIAIKPAGVEVTSQPVDGATPRGAPAREDFDYVVLAVPPGVWSQIAISPQAPEQAIGVMRSGPAVKLFTEVGRRFWIQHGQAPAGGSLALGQVWEGTDNQTRVPPVGVGGFRSQDIVLSAFAGGRKTTRAGMTTELARLFRGFPTSPRQLFADWPNEAFIRTGYCSPGRNQIFGLGPQLNQAFHARLFFAGEHTQLDHFGYMEGAIRSGERAAGQIIEAACASARRPGSPIRVASRDADPEEIIEPDERMLVRNAAAVPNRWICAIDVYDDHPAWGSGGPRYRLRGRGTGVLIGPRYLLTAAHVVERSASLAVSPGRSGTNGTHPLGRAGVRAIRKAAPFRVRRDVRQGGRVLRDVPFEIREDYALLILDADLGAAVAGRGKGPLGWWGAAGSGTRIRAVPPADLTGSDVLVTGYPGDRCGADVITGSAAEKERRIDHCVAQQPDAWASTQWAGRGVATADAHDTVLAHTVDTYSGQSGSPICLRSPDALDLVGVHTSPGTTANRGIRITDRMLTELCSWVNADAGAEVATVVDHLLRVAARVPAVKVPA